MPSRAYRPRRNTIGHAAVTTAEHAAATKSSPSLPVPRAASQCIGSIAFPLRCTGSPPRAGQSSSAVHVVRRC
eukprot:4478650-Pleurochrysis_carterae.AAC.3